MEMSPLARQGQNAFIKVEPLRHAFASYLDINVDERTMLRPSVGTRISADSPTSFHVKDVRTNPRVCVGGGGMPPRNTGIYLDCGPAYAMETRHTLSKNPNPAINRANRSSAVAKDAPIFFQVPGVPLSEKPALSGVWAAGYKYDSSNSSVGREVSHEAPESFQLGGQVPVGKPPSKGIQVLQPTRPTSPTSSAASREYAKSRAKFAAAKCNARRQAAAEQRQASIEALGYHRCIERGGGNSGANVAPHPNQNIAAPSFSNEIALDNYKKTEDMNVVKVKKKTDISTQNIKNSKGYSKHLTSVVKSPYISVPSKSAGNWFATWNDRNKRHRANRSTHNQKSTGYASRNKLRVQKDKNNIDGDYRPKVMRLSNELLSNRLIGGGMWL